MKYNVHVVNGKGDEVHGVAEGDSLSDLEHNLKTWLGEDVILLDATPTKVNPKQIMKGL